MEDIKWNDKKEVLKLVQQDGRDLKYASKKLRNDKDVVMTAVHQAGTALQFASKKLRNDKEIALAALQSSSYAFKYVSPRLKQDQDIQKAAGLESEKPDIDTVLGDAKVWCQEHNDVSVTQPQHNIER